MTLVLWSGWQPWPNGHLGLHFPWPKKLSAISAHGTVLHDCVAEGLRLIFTPIGVEDDEETRDDEGACQAGREGYLRCP